MPYLLNKIKTIKGVKIEDFLINEVKIKESLAQSLLKKGKITDENNKRLQINQTLKSDFINIFLFQAQTKGLKPIFQTEHFAIFDKPSGLLVHPSNPTSNEYTLFDEIRFLFGEKASLVHRIDKETSGLVLVSKNKYSEMVLKSMFEEKLYTKKYRAIVQGEIKKSIIIDTPIRNENNIIKIKMTASQDGKKSKTIINPLSYDKEKNQSRIEAIPITGRQHQIRVHLDSISHKIIGDPMYGVDNKIVDKFLKNELSFAQRVKMSGSTRLMLHAYYLEFEYFDIKYKFTSKQNF